MEALIGTDCDDAHLDIKGEKISLQDLALFPAFLRFRLVQLQYMYGFQSSVEKCELFDGCLHSIRPALNDSELIRFNCIGSSALPNQFLNHNTLIEYLRDRLLPICNTSRKYAFSICFCSDENKNLATDIIAPILQMSQVTRNGCCAVNFGVEDANPAQLPLPIESVSNWLIQNSNGREIRQEQRKMSIISSNSFQNIPEMSALLMTVNLN